ncbi:hypothetical protein BWZ22_04270 [Seonamhaeicola sp. S2-3]|uniref:sialidase family protein n=1 Tax=Seonamhaeicola sp. S2-3 TaxID=1936081 RepID=UPI000972C4B3|nr:sialidase family protein [Seonamhaeicola sp. S2-3]APY10500.1 hypothetical protein BWZ22_04270 [Seonamhaeicola sp. S2-3]
MKFKITLLALIFTAQMFSQKWTSTLPENPEEIFKSAIVYGYLNETIFASGSDGVQYYNNFIYSTDKGATWSSPVPIFTNTSNKEQVAQYLGVKDRMYAAVSSNLGYKYYYSTDNGSTWVLDTDGLPGKYTSLTEPEYKDAFVLAKLSEDYVVAYNAHVYNFAYYKKIGDAKWKPLKTYSNNYYNKHTAFTSIGNAWYALNGYVSSKDEKITKSNDFGATWQPISKTGLPDNFEGGFLVSNNQDKLFYGAGTTDTNSTDVYVSEDDGVTWQLTNAGALGDVEGELNFISNIYANNNDVIVTYYFPGFEDSPRYLYSNTESVLFKQGDITGIDGGGPFTGKCFFDIDGQFYAVFRYILYSENTSSLNIQDFNLENKLILYPNPTTNEIYINSNDSFSWQLYTISGNLLVSGSYKKGVLSASKISLKNLSKGVYLFKTSMGESKKVVVQ